MKLSNSMFLLGCLVGGFGAGALPLVSNLLMTPAHADTRILPFQGRLTDAAGNAIADGARVVEFKLYDAPTGGNAKWAGEVHKLSVNGGLVNTMLGSKASLGGVDFGTATFLQITVDANNDGAITAADPPLLPRQSVVPAVYATVAGEIQYNSGGPFASVRGSDLFDAAGRIKAPAIAADNGITAAQLAADSVETQEIRNGSVTLAKLAPEVSSAFAGSGSVTSQKILDGDVQNADLANGAVTLQKLGADAISRLEAIEGRLNRIESGQWEPVLHDYGHGSLQLNTTATISHDLPAAIPLDAKEILVYASMYIGGVPQLPNHNTVTIYTRRTEPAVKDYVHLLAWEGYANGAVPFNSSTFWLPVTSERKIHTRNNRATTLNQGSKLIILGYR